MNISRFRALKGFAYDSRTLRKGQAFIAVKGRFQDGHDFIGEADKKGAGLIVAERLPACRSGRPVKSVSAPVMLVKDSRYALKILARHVRYLKNPYVYAITGSVGKTTTKEMLVWCLKSKHKTCANLKTENNLFGLSRTIFSLKKEKILVAELGTNSPGEIKELAEVLLPNAGLITFVKPVHLEKLKSLPGVFKEKTALLESREDTVAVLNADDEYLRKYKGPAKVYWYGTGKGSGLRARFLSRQKNTVTFLLNSRYQLCLPISRENFVYNALAAISAASLSGMTTAQSVKRMNRFRGYPDGRMDIKKVGALCFVNDAYNSNPYALKETLKVFKDLAGHKIAVLADMLELGTGAARYHQAAAKDILCSGVDHCLTLGGLSRHTYEALRRAGFTQARHYATHSEVSAALKRIVEADPQLSYTVLLKGSRAMHLEKVMELFAKPRSTR